MSDTFVRVVIRKGRTAQVQMKPRAQPVRIVQSNSSSSSSSAPQWTNIQW